jgi:hypothetical protein
MPLLKRQFFARTVTIHSQATGYIQSSRATMPVLTSLTTIANLNGCHHRHEPTAFPAVFQAHHR